MKFSRINVDTRPTTQMIPPSQRVFIAYLFFSSPAAFIDSSTSDDDMGDCPTIHYAAYASL